MKVKLTFKNPNDMYQLFRKIDPDGTTTVIFSLASGVEVTR